MPAILAGKQELEMNALKKFAYHAGIAFQIKDDLLDVEGDQALLGKPIGKDVENNNSTFVSILGADGARKAMWEHYCLAMEVLQEMQHQYELFETFIELYCESGNSVKPPAVPKREVSNKLWEIPSI